MTTLRKPVSRTTVTPLASDFFGPDRGKRLTVTLTPGNGSDVADVLTLRPLGTRRPETVALIDVYQWALKCRCNKEHLERAREKKAAKDRQRKERALRRSIRAVNR